MKLIHNNSLINTPYSLQKYVKSFQQWDKIHAFNIESALIYEAFLSVCDSNKIMGDYYIINSSLKANKNLQIWTFQEWKTIGTIKIGDYIFNDNYKYIKVDSIEEVSESVAAVEVETTANYFLERYLVK
jgi:hypothetical protein